MGFAGSAVLVLNANAEVQVSRTDGWRHDIEGCDEVLAQGEQCLVCVCACCCIVSTVAIASFGSLGNNLQFTQQLPAAGLFRLQVNFHFSRLQ